MMLVFASSPEVADHWARGYNIKRHTWRFVRGPDDVRGYTHCGLVLLPECRLTEPQQQAMAYLRAMGALTP
jgi:hypothetical protein